MLKKEKIGMKHTNKMIGIVDGDVLIYRAMFQVVVILEKNYNKSF
jgi:hypothetical protein